MASVAVPGLRLARYQGDLANPDHATAQTVELMCAQIAKSAQDPVVQLAAKDAVFRFRGGPLNVFAGFSPTDPACMAESAWWWAKCILKFVHHDGLIAVWFNERDQLQLLISPDLLLRMQKPRGDCAIYTMLICALLKCCGVSFEIVTAAVDPDTPDLFTHVYPRALLPNGRRFVLDASHGSYPGWEVPPQHIIRKQVWDESGNPIPDTAPRFQGLHAYNPYPRTPILPKRILMMPGIPFRGLGRFRGLGQDAAQSIQWAEQADYGIPSAQPTAPGQPSGGINWGQFIQNITTQGLNLVGRITAPTTTIQAGPKGTYIETPAGTPLPTGALFTPGVAGGIGMGTILIGGVVLVALFAALGSRR